MSAATLRRLAAFSAALLALGGCTDDSAPDAARLTLAPDATAPSDPSGFAEFVGPGGDFTVAIPSGWTIAQTGETTVVRPPDGSDTPMLVVTDLTHDGTLDEALADIDQFADADRADASVPGAAEAVRLSGTGGQPFDAVAAISDGGQVVVVTIIGDGALSADERETLLTSVELTGAG